MTSNQVANAANMINQQVVDESVRHNNATETEVNRHNTVTEDIAKEQLALEAKKLDVDQRYKEESLRIQEEYNKAYIAWQQAQGQEKLNIEAYLAEIEARKTFNDEQYKRDITRLGQDELELKQRIQAETERANQRNEELKERQVANEEWKSFLQGKSIEYQNSYWNASIALGNLKAVYENQASFRNYELGLMNIEKDETIAKAQLERDLAQLTAQKPIYNAQTFKYYLEGMGSLFSSATRPFTIWAFGK